MKKKLHEKSSHVIEKSPHNFAQQNSTTTSFEKEKSVMNGVHGSRIPGTAMDSTNSLVEPRLEDLQAANCVIS